MKPNIFSRFLLAVAALVGLGLTAIPAYADGYGTKTETHGSVTCRTWVTQGNLYPADDSHLWVCLANTTRAIQIYNTVAGNSNISTFLKNHGVTYYYFQNRADTKTFMDAKFLMNVGNLSSTTAKCGNTGTSALRLDIISEIYETCSYTAANTQNPNIAKVTSHESGHAFDFSLARDYGSNGPGVSQGFRQLAIADLAVLTPCNWSNGASCSPVQPTMTQAQKDNYVCGIFSAKASTLELALNAKSNEPICDSTGHTVLAPYVGLTPTAIAKLRAPYFVGGTGAGSLYEDLFAEEFALWMGGGSPNPLEMTDRIIGTNSSPIPDFKCTRWVLERYWFLQIPPPAFPDGNSLKAKGCPDVDPSKFKLN